MSKYLVVIFILACHLVNAQIILGVGTKWGDEFTEWDLIGEEDEILGEIKMRWQNKQDYTEWDYSLNEARGSIIQPWDDDKSQWEVRSEGEVISCRTAWNNDFSEWKITDNENSLHLRSRWKNNFNEWELRTDNHGFFAIYTTWENDPRDWTIIDELDEEISEPMKMALIFLATYHSYPKN